MLVQVYVQWFECITKYPEGERLERVKYTLIQV